MESVDMKKQELEVRKEFEHWGENISILSARTPATYLTSIENQYVNDIETQLKKDNGDQKNVYIIQWAEQNNNENCNVVHQVLIQNCSEQKIQRYADFVVNGHFLTALLPIETSEVTSTFKECPTCNKKLKPGSFKRHLSYCKKLPDLQCNYCSFQTKKNLNLRNHTRLMHADKYEPEKDANLICPICDKKLKSQKSLEIHKYFCKNPQYFHCNGCSYHTEYKSNLMRHINTLHCSDQSAACPKCGKRLKNRKTLSVHLYYCGKKPHLHCDICSYKTKYKRDFIVHSAKVHFKDAESIKMSNEIFKNVQASAIAKAIGNAR